MVADPVVFPPDVDKERARNNWPMPALLSAEIGACTGHEPGEHYRELAHHLGEPVANRVEASTTVEQKQKLAKLSPRQLISHSMQTKF